MKLKRWPCQCKYHQRNVRNCFDSTNCNEVSRKFLLCASHISIGNLRIRRTRSIYREMLNDYRVMLINPFHTTHGREVVSEKNETIRLFPFEHIFVEFTEICEFVKSMDNASNVYFLCGLVVTTKLKEFQEPPSRFQI